MGDPLSGRHSNRGVLFGYARISTDDQSLGMQTSALVQAGVDADRIFTDTASGVTAQRPGLQSVLKALRPGDTLVAWKLDRITRDLFELLRIERALRERGVGLRLLTEYVDTTTPAGRMLFSIMGVFAQFEREVIQERTKAGLRAAQAAGKKLGAKRKMTDEDVDRAIHLMRSKAEGGEGLTRVAAAKRLGVGKSTLHRELAARETGGKA